MRKVLLFKLNGEIVAEQTTNLFLSDIEKFKQVIAEELDCNFDDIEVSTICVNKELSHVDVTPEGLMLFDEWSEILQGVVCVLDEGSDAYLDALTDGTIYSYLIFKP